jgi:signal transduction histidine kinase
VGKGVALGTEEESALAQLGRHELMDGIRHQLDELTAARDQTEKLLHVVLGINSDLELDATLDRIVDAAMELTGARYGALAVRAEDGRMLSFIHHGMDAETIANIGDLPVGKGLLSIPLDDTPALRLDELCTHPGAAGFPEDHPAMHAFLGVPITVRDNVFGSLYLTHDEIGRTFSESDEVSARVLASAAAAAIDNAQLFDRVRITATWMQASREIATALLSESEPLRRPMQLIAERACELTNAEQAIVLVPTAPSGSAEQAASLVVSTAVGVHADDVLGQHIPIDGSTSGGVFTSGEPMITESFRHPIQAFTDVGQRPAIAVPLADDENVIGVMVVARHQGDPPFDRSYLDLVTDFASHAAIALALAAGRERERELTILADRERIAHDLHDHVIQRLFAAGLDLQGSIARSRSPEVNARLTRTIDDLQATIETIRSTIFELQSPLAASTDFRTRLEKLIADLTEDRGLITAIRFSGPLTAVADIVADNAEAVTAEAISNAVRHSGASRIDISVTVADNFTLEVTDDGGGIPPRNNRASGLANMHRRAEVLGGVCDIGPGTDGGTRVHWTVPLIAE